MGVKREPEGKGEEVEAVFRFSYSCEFVSIRGEKLGGLGWRCRSGGDEGLDNGRGMGTVAG